jgi:carbamate kinase
LRIVIALGGNALLRRGERLDAQVQRANVRGAASMISRLAVAHELILTHGNGPQVGLLALQSAACAREVTPYPLDVLGAESEGMIGYMLEQELLNAAPGTNVATLLTQTVVSADDPAFEAPTKFVGPQYDETEARRLGDERGWKFQRDGKSWRRVVPSPRPREFLELRAIRTLVANRFLVICAGGGGVPVVRRRDGTISGVEAVVDKDLASALLADALCADCLLMLTDVSAAFINFGTERQRPIRRASPAQVRGLPFPAGSMGPKIEAAVEFASTPGRRACIGSLEDAAAILAGSSGTTIEAGVPILGLGPTD